MNRKNFFKTLYVLGIATIALPKLNAKKLKYHDSGKLSSKYAWISGAKIFPVGKEVELIIEFNQEFLNKANKLKIEYSGEDSARPFHNKGRRILEIPVVLKENKLTAKITFQREQGYAFSIYDISNPQKAKRPIQTLSVYALNDDLFSLNAYKGDTHMHTKVSDGKETVEEALVSCLEIGCDFFAVSDHRKYEGSEKAVKICKDIPLSIATHNAEECHFSSVHVHNWGGNQSLTNWINNNPKEYEKLWKKILKTIPKMPIECDRECVAKTEAEFEIVRKFGGLSVFNHPYWINGKYLSIPDSVIDMLFERHNFDAFEIANSATDYCICNVGNAKLAELRSKGIDIPIIGVSDAHRKEEHGIAYTLIFAKNPSFNCLKDSVLDFKSVAVYAPCGSPQTMFGKIRYLRYADFLNKEYFPEHDRLCKNEADALKEVFANKSKPEDIAKLKKCTDAVKHYRKTFKFNI